jgi:DNA-binding NarL/FixJ family response regulator
MKVLLVSNDFDLNVSLQILLREEPQCEVIGSVSNIGSARQLIKTDCPDLIVLDWDLPSGDATEVLAATQSASCPFAVIVIGKDEADQSLAVSAGARAFVIKGTSPEELLIVIRKLYDHEQVNFDPMTREANQL